MGCLDHRAAAVARALGRLGSLAVLLGGVAGSLWSVRADSIINSKHNLSASGPGEIRAATESEICIFCHTPHLGAREAPLWNRFSSGTTYIPYSSSTAKAKVGQPTGASKLCLSCHDGTIALGLVRSRPAAIPLRGGVTGLPPGRSRLDTDLADDHPVSFTYDAGLAAASGELHHPETLRGPVRLENDQLQCTACHDPHNNRFGRFLVVDNAGSALCVTCHDPASWAKSSHRNSTKTWNGQGNNPWPHTAYTTVQENGCENCHRPHGAGGKPRLLNHLVEEENCYSCHNGNVASHNIEAEFSKLSAHPVDRTTGVHDPTENPLTAPRHVECVDCHNPHVSPTPAVAAAEGSPIAPPSLPGVKGISIDGTVVTEQTKEYELCFRCHADSVERGPASVPRQIAQTNARLQFRPSNASFHPVAAVGKNPKVPSLITPWNPTSRMSCTDCHSNDRGPGAGGTGPRGPHGSQHAPLLERRLELSDYQIENTATYALCYKCHSRDSILGDQSFPYHRLHIVQQQAACTTCHDSHGVENNPHLINFNTLYVSDSTKGPRKYLSTGPRSGSCTLSCHGKDHEPLTYEP